MLIPEIFFGTLNSVKNNCKKVITEMRRGSLLEDCLNSVPLIESDNFTDSYFWVDRSWSALGQQKHFILSEFGQVLVNDSRMLADEKNRLINNNINYLSSCPWGAIMINATQVTGWIKNLATRNELRINGCEAVINGFKKYYPLFKEQGLRFYSGGNNPESVDHVILLVILAYSSLSNENRAKIETVAKSAEHSINLQSIYKTICSD